MIRHIHWYVAAPGREAEGERALKNWIGLMETADGFRGAEVLREVDHLLGVVAVVQLWDSAEAATAFNAANRRSNPTLADIPGPTPADQGSVLFGHRHDHDGHGHGDEPHHAHEDHELSAGLDYNRGGGLFARLLHGHFEVVVLSPPESDLSDPSVPRETG